jgi:hypothetical protein
LGDQPVSSRIQPCGPDHGFHCRCHSRPRYISVMTPVLLDLCVQTNSMSSVAEIVVRRKLLAVVFTTLCLYSQLVSVHIMKHSAHTSRSVALFPPTVHNCETEYCVADQGETFVRRFSHLSLVARMLITGSHKCFFE